MNIGLIGSGGREHALCKAIHNSNSVNKIVCFPGNAGTATLAVNINVDILNFQKDYDNVALYRLEQNYRSTQNIVNAANSIINHNETKLDKKVWTANDTGNKIKVQRCPTDADEGRHVASSIFDFNLTEQRKYTDFAILYRTNAQSRAMEDALRKRNIPYKIFGGLSFYQRKEIKDTLAYLRVIINPKMKKALSES